VEGGKKKGEKLSFNIGANYSEIFNEGKHGWNAIVLS
jgi:hypothetical protein